MSDALHWQEERSLVEKERKRVEQEKCCIEEEKRLAALEIEQRASMARAELEAGRERYFFALLLATDATYVLSLILLDVATLIIKISMSSFCFRCVACSTSDHRMAKEAEQREAELAIYAARAEQARAIEARATDEVRMAEQLRDALLRTSVLRSKGWDGGLASMGNTKPITIPTVAPPSSSSYNGGGNSNLDYKDEKTIAAITEQNKTMTDRHQRQQDELENQRKIQLEHERLVALTELTKTQQRELERQRLLVRDPSTISSFIYSLHILYYMFDDPSNLSTPNTSTLYYVGGGKYSVANRTRTFSGNGSTARNRRQSTCHPTGRRGRTSEGCTDAARSTTSRRC